MLFCYVATFLNIFLNIQAVNRSPSLSEFLKKQRQKASNNNNNENEVEFLYISPTTTPAVSSHAKIQSKETIKVLCENDFEFVLPYEAAIKSKFIANIFSTTKEIGIQYKEIQEHVVRLPQFRADVLEEISFF